MRTKCAYCPPLKEFLKNTPSHTVPDSSNSAHIDSDNAPLTPYCFAFKAKDTNLRLNSSSGGIFSLLARSVLEQGGVVFGVGYDENLRVVHTYIEGDSESSHLDSEKITESNPPHRVIESKQSQDSNSDPLENLRRSKYVQSDKGDSFRQVKALLKQGRKVLFSGVQCEIQGLLSYLKKPYENLLTCEVICNSVPSPKVWEIYKESLCEEEGEKLVNFNFRGKDYGWERGIFAITTKTKTIPHYESLYMRGFLSHLITRPSCENCYAKDGRSGADITLGDYWGVGHAHPSFSDDVGVSCVIAHNTKALSALESIKESGEWELSTYEHILAGNHALLSSGHINPARKQALSEIMQSFISNGARESIKVLERYLPPIQKPKKRIFKRIKHFLRGKRPKPKKAKKIGIVTYVMSHDNYGQILQNYALHRYLSRTYPRADVVTFANVQWLIYTPLKRLYKVFETNINLLFGKRKNMPSAIDAKRGFLEFRKSHITMSSPGIGKILPKAIAQDVFIVGSDQVWNNWGMSPQSIPKITKHAFFAYLLGFVDKSKRAFRRSKKIAYAPSIGSMDIPEGFEELFRQCLSSFDALSVREECNVASLKKLGLDSICVPDPTMLLSREQYLSIATPLASKSEVFVYMLGANTLVDKDEALAFVEEDLRGENACADKCSKILYANANVHFSCKYDKTTDFYPTPQEWIGAIADSKLLITNSFHACVFAIIMNTPFLALKLGGTAGAMNTRFETLLEIFGLQDRLCSGLEEFKAKYRANAPIDWYDVNLRLRAWSQVGKDYLAKYVGVHVS